MKPLLDAVRPTTLIKSDKLNLHLGLDLTIASETFQHTGSFKFRAAYNVVSSVEKDEFIGVSSGNFGQALAYSCMLLGRKCTVVMPHNSAAVKVEAVRSFGAEVDLIDVNKVSRAERTRQLANERPDAYVASAYDDEYVIAGNSSLGDELSCQNFDTVIVPVGGGGLIAGFIQSFQRNDCSIRLLGAEPAMANDAARSLQAGELIKNDAEPQTIADGARTLSLGKLNWDLIRTGRSEIIEVPDQTIVQAARSYFQYANLKSEPTGALSLGAVLTDPDRFRDQTVCVVVSGGNVDARVYSDMINS